MPLSSSLVMHEKSQQNDDRQWDADEPKKQSSSEAHLCPPSLEFLYCFLNDKARQRFPRPMERYYKLKVGTASCDNENGIHRRNSSSTKTLRSQYGVPKERQCQTRLHWYAPAAARRSCVIPPCDCGGLFVSHACKRLKARSSEIAGKNG
jgi:hypothetical protein